MKYLIKYSLVPRNILVFTLLYSNVTERRRRSLHGRLPSGTPCPRVRFAYSLRQLRVVYYLPTPLILTIDRAMSYRLLKYIRSVAIAYVP